MEIRKSTDRDADAIIDIFASAKRYMKENGNASQWDDSYPDRATLERDIGGGNSYVFVDGLALVAFDCIARTRAPFASACIGNT